MLTGYGIYCGLLTTNFPVNKVSASLFKRSQGLQPRSLAHANRVSWWSSGGRRKHIYVR